MTLSGILFFIILFINTIIAIAYYVWFVIHKQETDNRKQYLMNTIIMIVCPIVGICYFLLSFFKYHFIKIGDRDLSDVEFSKKRHAPRIKADEKRERNIVSVEEAILVSDQEKKRTNMLNVLLGDTKESLSAIALALNSDDSEVAHYAASFLQSKMDTFRKNVNQSLHIIQQSQIEDVECQKQILELIHYMNHMLKQKVFMQVEQIDYVNQMEQLCQQLYENAKYQLTPSCYEWILERMMELQDYDKARMWGERFREQYPDQLSSYTLRLKLNFESGNKEKFFEVLDELRASHVVVDNQTLELIRMLQE